MIYDLIIIGGGPAGVAAGIYASRKKINALLVTKDFSGHWVVSDKIENFIGFKGISGIELAKTLEDHLRSQEEVIDIKDGVLVSSIKKIDSDQGFEVAISNGETFQTKNILLAIGSGYKKLGVPGEKDFEGRGVFYCATCDAPLMKGKTAVVVGGGNSGFESAFDLLPYASEIFILNRNSTIKADQIYQEKAAKEAKMKIITDAETQEIFGDVFVKGLKYKDLKTNEIKTIETSGVFVEIGYQPNTDLVKDLVQLDAKGQVIVDHKTFQSTTPGIWAAGDINDGLFKQMTVAASEGICALLSIYANLKK